MCRESLIGHRSLCILSIDASILEGIETRRISELAKRLEEIDESISQVWPLAS
jgi:hypothetical protein